ncbi:substrate-binding domain-containing protein [Mycoplasmopsis alligatoris]|uniref:Periplasmic binding protein domain-containing protein n=1 Tax=Mycoplasmopsis alligatoris A21JP2 TaxID=747682 RepID=D4XWW6_9BACT|nr:substrate-binding domain-containing protein [Mycoplasmopsis alligatoris]EFF41231.1 conserved hypothetical protein [Mycoplasmopsis alligatoris A21JP2]
MRTKKLLITLGALSAITLAGAIAVSCGTSSTAKSASNTTTPTTAQSPRVAISDPDNPRWLKAQKELLAAFDSHKIGAVSSIVKDQTQQNSFIDSAVAGGTKGLIIGAVDGNTVSGSVTAAAGKGVKVVAYDRLISGTDKYDWYTTFDNSNVGELQGLYLLSGIYKKMDAPFKTMEEAVAHATANKLSEESFVYTLGGGPSDNNSSLFYGGAKKVIDAVMKVDSNLKFARNNESFEVAAVDNWDYSKAQSGTQTFLTSFAKKDKIVAVLAPNDGMANAAITALKQLKLDTSKISITGQDFNDDAIMHIKAGDQLMTIYKPDSSLAKVAVAILKEIMKEENASKTPEQVFELVKASLPDDLKTMVTLDKTQYKSTDTHNINTIILTPTVVTKTNISQYEGK